MICSFEVQFRENTMNENSALVSLAMLKVDSDVHGRDYLDYLIPFIFYVLEKYRPEPVTSNGIRTLLKDEFKLRIPVYPTELVLQRLAKRKYLAKEHSIYKIVKSIPAGSVDTLRTDAQTRTQSVLTALQEFAISVHSVIWSEEEASAAIATYLAHFSVDCLKSYAQKTALPEIQSSSGQKSLFIVNTFVIYLKEKLPAVFENLIVLVKGQLLANALICSDLDSIPRKFNGVTFYLDTPLILQLFGLEGKYLETAVSELLELLRNLKGTIAVFEHTVEEVHGVIEGCERHLDNPHAKGGLIITEMRRAAKTASDLALTKARLPDLYRKFDISKRTTPSYTPSLQIDENILHQALEDEISYANPRAADYDVNSIRSIYGLRRGKQPHRLEDAGAVLVTSNSALARVAYEYGKENEAIREVSAVITSFSLANMAWLKAPLGAPDLPRFEIMATCYAAMNPPDALWSAYLAEIEKLKQLGDISARDHELLRFSLRARDELMNLTLGSEEAFSEKTVSQILQRVQSEIAAEKDELLHRQRTEHEAETSRITREAEARVEEERTRFLTTKAELEKEVARNARISKRLYWISDQASGVLALLLVAGIAAILIAGSFFSESYVKRFLPGYRWASILLTLTAWLAVAWGVFHAIFGFSVIELGRSLRSVLQNEFYRFLCNVFSVEPSLSKAPQ